MELIENLNFERLGTTLIIFRNHDKKKQVYLDNNYETYANIAFSHMEKLLNTTENPNDNLIKIRDNDSLQVITWSFIATESFISLLLKLYYYDNDEDFQKIISKPLTNRLNHIFDIFEVKFHQNQKSLINSYIDDFCTFRNDIFHDRILRINRVYKKTYFSKYANEYNLCDAIQSYLIMLNLFNSLRFIIDGYDFMPKILVEQQNRIFNINMDKICTEYQIPTLKKILEKHNYSTLINLELFFKQSTGYSFDFKYEIAKIIKAIPDKKQTFNNSLTNIKNTEYKKFILKYIKNQSVNTMKFNDIKLKN